jgi:hypothetical protein
MAPTIVHDLQSKRYIDSLSGELIRCYPLTMALVEKEPMAVRHVVLSDCSGWVRVKLWGQDAIDAARGQFIWIHNVWCYQKDGNLWLSVGRKSRLTFRTQP